MKTLITVILLCQLSLLAQANAHGGHSLSGKPLCFIENKGQVADQYGAPRNDIQYCLAAAPGLNIFIGNGAIHYQFSKSNNPPPAAETQCIASPPHTGIASLPHTRNISLSSGNLSRSFIGKGRGEVSLYRLDMILENANHHAKIITDIPQCYYENYYTNGKSIRAESYSKITYQNIYPHIDWVLYIKDNQLEYDFIVRPGGNINDIKIRYNGASGLTAASNAITAVTPLGQIEEGRLYSYVLQTGQEIASGYESAGNVFRFHVAPHKGTIVIDPWLQWATYYGGTGIITESETDPARILTTAAGDIIITGGTSSTANIATAGAYQTILKGEGNAFLAAFNSSGAIEWATYLGGNSADGSSGLAVDHNGNIFIGGNTYSTNFPVTPGCHQSAFGGGNDDGFLAKFTGDGSLLWATYYGGTGDESSNGSVICDGAGNVYVTGGTTSSNGIATPGACKASANDSFGTAFLAKFSGSGSLLWGTYYGGDSANEAVDMTIDAAGNVYITGITNSLNGIATPGAYQTSYGGGISDVFIAKFTGGGELAWATYYGGNGQDQSMEIKSDGAGNIYLCGNTYSTNGIATPGAYKTMLGDTTGDYSDAFLAKFSATGAILWATYYGGNDSNGGDGAIALAIGSTGNIYMAGNTTSPDSIATAGAYQPSYHGAYDAFIAGFTSGGSLLWGSYFGGPEFDYSADIACDDSGNFYLLGYTQSPTGIATPGAYDAVYHGTGAPSDQGVTFIAKFDSLTNDSVHIAPKPGISIYPNPTQDMLYVTWQGFLAPQVQLSVINMAGQKVYNTTVSSTADHTTINTSLMPDGMYVCVLQSGVNKYYSKFTVLR